jgi:hypothetical protein
VGGYGSFSTLVTDAKREALIAEMTCNGWEFKDEHVFTKSQNYGESYASQSVTLDGQASASSYSGGASMDDDKGLAQATLDEFNQVKSKWETNIDTLVTGFDNLPEPGNFNAAIGSLQLAAQKVAAGTGNKNSELGNADLTDIGFMRDRLPTLIGDTVDTFYRLYGPDRLELVLDGYCQAMGCLGAALKGEEKIWTNAQVDAAQIMTDGVAAFTATRQNNSHSWSTDLTVGIAAVGLLSAFTAGIPGLPAVLGGVSASGTFLQAAMGALGEGTKGSTGDQSGSHPDEVYEGLETAFKALNNEIKEQEQKLQKMCQTMLGLVNAAGNRANFHIGPDAGLDPEYKASDDIIDLKYSILRTIGYECMPQIANAFCQSADAAMAGVDKTPWARYYSSVVGDWIGLDFYGFFDTWEDLVYRVQPLMNDTAAEVVAAGIKLAVAAGYLEDTDGDVQAALGKNYKDLEGAKLGWNKDSYEPPPPPPPPRGMGGRPFVE